MEGDRGGHQSASVVFTSPNMALGDHTLKMRTTGKASGYPAIDFFVQLNAFNVFDDGNTVDPPIASSAFPTSGADAKI